MAAFCVLVLYARQFSALALESWLKHRDPELPLRTHDISRRLKICITHFAAITVRLHRFDLGVCVTHFIFSGDAGKKKIFLLAILL